MCFYRYRLTASCIRQVFAGQLYAVALSHTSACTVRRDRALDRHITWPAAVEKGMAGTDSPPAGSQDPLKDEDEDAVRCMLVLVSAHTCLCLLALHNVLR